MASVTGRKPVDQVRRRAIRSLKIAHAAHNLGNYTALAWIAKGLNEIELTPDDMQYFQQARSIIHANKGRLKQGDVERLLERWRGGPN